jgi:heme exporter protein D
MDAIADYFSMGGYAAFVWPTYLIAAAVLAGMLAASVRFLRTTEATLAALERATNEAGGNGETP